MRKLSVVLIILVLLTIVIAPLTVSAQTDAGTNESSRGFTLYSPIGETTTYLINMDGTVVHQWESDYRPGHSVYLLENGNLLRTGAINTDSPFPTGGGGGIIEEYTWDGDLVWSYTYATDTVLQHHDIEPMPNGNILMIAWERKTESEMLEVGRQSDLMPTASGANGPGAGRPNGDAPNGNGPSGNSPNGNPPGRNANTASQSTEPALYVDHVVEVNPATNEIVWEWHLWDHLVQDSDVSLTNYGVISENPAKVNINYVGGNTRRISDDWTHINGIDYNAELDQILLSVHNFNEIWIIDHSLDTAQAATSAGDLLYRWGDPAAYDQSGTQVLYSQHNAQWVPDGYPGAGNITIFNNGNQQTRAYSTVEEIAPSLNADGTYTLDQDVLVWNYTASPAESLFAERISGAQRLPNGNTLITEGTTGRVIEVTPSGKTVWEYRVPSSGNREASIFRAERYAPDYPAFTDKNLELSAN